MEDLRGVIGVSGSIVVIIKGDDEVRVVGGDGWVVVGVDRADDESNRGGRTRSDLDVGGIDEVIIVASGSHEEIVLWQDAIDDGDVDTLAGRARDVAIDG